MSRIETDADLKNKLELLEKQITIADKRVDDARQERDFLIARTNKVKTILLLREVVRESGNKNVVSI